MKTKFLALLAPLMILTACYDNSSPTKVLKSIGAAVEKNDMKAYPTFFTGRAKEQYGNAQGMQILKNKGVGKKLSLSKAVELSRQPQNARAWTSLYAVDVLSEGRTLARSKVTCQSDVRRETDPRQCETSCVDNPNGGQRCFRSCTGGISHDVTYTNCAVSELNF